MKRVRTDRVWRRLLAVFKGVHAPEYTSGSAVFVPVQGLVSRGRDTGGYGR